MQEGESKKSLTELDIAWVERAVLSSYIYNYADVINLSEIEAVAPEFFQNAIPRQIFQTLLTLEVKNGSFDPILIYESLKSNNQFNQSFLESCSDYLTNLPRRANFFNFRKYLEILRNNWVKKELNNLSQEILQTRCNSDIINDLIARWEKSFLEITLKDRKLNYLSSKEVVKSYDYLVESSQTQESDRYLTSGYSLLDFKIKGFKPGQFVVIASRPGVGKTTFALNLINNNLHKISPPFKAEKENAIGIFSLEMINEIIIEKLIAIDSKTELYTLQRLTEGKKVQDLYLGIIENSKKRLSEANLLFCDDANITLGKIIATIKLWARKYSLKLVIIDYLQLINLPLDKELNNLNPTQKISLISRQLKILAMELNICILSLSQLNRKLEERRGSDRIPVLSDLRDSGSIEQDADIVIFLFPSLGKKMKEVVELEDEIEMVGDEELNYSTEISLKIGKNRYGPTGIIRFLLDKEIGKFSVTK
ncbi:DNA helicase [Mycoplasma wenyonii]|uniref:DNA 5'-3' helicase n=1 Tax=Mycoplasma wenyonii TaxID=65123 RepID=A0A328PK80_9MOLU|nr:DnaB-like helicase C-terminal domain-containing protein [Mycoplasma wenyonii]RAO95262.1 DNA helicase [Mycoplasma wenyonii]